MADSGPPALAHAPPSPASTAPATSDTTMKPANGSPVSSEKTAVASARLRELIAQPGTYAAVFSTDGGRLPRRSIPLNAPPVIVRSAGMKDALSAANYWRERHPAFYPCFFPNHGWTIADLWDEYDMHLESPEFLKEVLHVILYGNQQSAINFAYNWCLENPDKMGKLSGDLKHFEANPLAMVDEFFSDQELEHFPRQYLLYALWVLRDSMHRYQAKCCPTSAADSGGSLVNNQPLQPVMKDHHTNLNPQQQYSMPVSLRKSALASYIPHTDCLIGSAPPAQQLSSYGPVVHVPHMPRVRNSSCTPFHPPASNFHHGGAAISTTAQAMKQPHNVRRPDRSGSHSYAQPPQPYMNGENVRLPAGGHTHHPIGPPHGGPHHLVSNIPIGPGMVSPGQRGLHALPNTALTSPPIHPSQIAYPTPTGHLVFSAPGSIPPQVHQSAYQQFDQQATPHVTPFVNLANNVPHAPVRGHDIRSISGPSGQNTKIPGLYNPYDASRPEKAGFVNTGPRKGSRGNLTNNMGRGHKYSAGAFDRSVSNVYPPDYPDNSGRFTTVDTSITNDKEFGCDFNSIGPKNTTVRQLYVRNIPDCISVPEIRTLFQNHAKAMPNTIEIKSYGEGKEFYSAIISFDSTDDARKALAARLPPLKGKIVQVSVAKRHFSLGAHHCTMSQDSNRSTGDAGQPTQSNPYSPQDARSDLHQVNGQHRQSKVHISRGSPEARKAKKPVINKEDRADDVLNKVNDSKLISESSHVENLVGKIEAKVAIANTASDNPPAESKTTLPKTGTAAGKEEIVERSNAKKVPLIENAPNSPKTITESIPINAQTALLASPTKVNLPPVDHGSKVVHSNSKKTVAAEDKQNGGNFVSVPSQEDAASDDDQKHDLSFHSAQESPPYISCERDQRDQKADSVHEEEEKSGSITGKHIELDDDQKPTVTNTGGGQEVNTNNNLACEFQEGKGAVIAASKPPTELGRKNGAKQTESLNPYSKAYKAQLKKMKDKERKQKKKDKNETTGKEEMNGAAKINIAAENGEKEDLHKVSSRASTQGLLVQEDDDVEGQAQQDVDVKDVKQGRSDQLRSPPKSAQPCDGTGLQAYIATTTKDERIETSNNQRQTSETGQGVRSTSTVIAIPKLDSLKKRSSTTAIAPPSTPQRTEEDNMDTARDDREDLHNHQALNASREASSLVGSTNPPARVCSPRAKEFHTPVQMPTESGRPTAEPATQKKKKKNNKKKAKDAGGVSGQQSEEAFHEQLSQVKNTQTGYYALRDSDGPAQEVFVRKEEKGPKSLIRQVQAYVKEKTSGYSRAPESTWSRDNRKQVEKVTAAESEQIVNGTRSAVNPAIVRYKQDAMAAKGEASQAGKAGKVPLFK